MHFLDASALVAFGGGAAEFLGCLVYRAGEVINDFAGASGIECDVELVEYRVVVEVVCADGLGYGEFLPLLVGVLDDTLRCSVGLDECAVDGICGGVGVLCGLAGSKVGEFLEARGVEAVVSCAGGEFGDYVVNVGAVEIFVVPLLAVYSFCDAAIAFAAFVGNVTVDKARIVAESAHSVGECSEVA